MPALRVQAKKKTSGKDFTTRQTRINTMEEPMTSSPSWLSLSLAFRCLTILVFCFPLFAANIYPTAAHEAPTSVISDLVGSVRPSVVSIYMRGLLDPDQAASRTGPPQIYEQVGTGSIVSSEGYIITNKHVVKNAYHIEVTLYDGTHTKGQVLGAARNFDLAVVKIPKSGLPAVKLGDSNQVKVGELVIAIGNPLGLQQTVSAGVVSAIHRNMGFSDFDDLIQTDAAINPGNSGGPLFNSDGELIGINQAIYTIGAEKGSIGLGFAIASNQARYLFDHVQTGSTDQGVLGASIQRLTPELARASSSDRVTGVLVAEVLPGSAAAKAGVQAGDIITRFADQTITDTSQLNRAVVRSATETKNLSFERGGKEINVSVFIPETSEPTIIPGQLPGPRLTSLKDVGLELGAKDTGEVVVGSVVDNSVADVTGFKTGDIVLAVQNAKITKASDFDAAIAKSISDKVPGVRILLSNQKGRRWVYLALTE